jgi:hypothetical protein
LREEISKKSKDRSWSSFFLARGKQGITARRLSPLAANSSICQCASISLGYYKAPSWHQRQLRQTAIKNFVVSGYPRHIH